MDPDEGFYKIGLVFATEKAFKTLKLGYLNFIEFIITI